MTLTIIILFSNPLKGLLASTPMCKKGFSRQNPIKSHLQPRLELEILDALMWTSLVDTPVVDID